MSFSIFLKGNKNKIFRDIPIREYLLEKKSSYLNEIILNHKFSRTDHKKNIWEKYVDRRSKWFSWFNFVIS